MKIKKYQKVGKNKYRLSLSNGKNLLLYEDVILKFELLLKGEIKDLSTIIAYNEKYALYDKTLSYLNKKLRSEKEIIKYLEKYTTDEDVINEIILKLKNDQFLNNELYIKSYIHDKLYLSLDGPYKIKSDLEKLGFKEEEIEPFLSEFTPDVIASRLNKYLTKQLKVNKKSYLLFKNKMYHNLIGLGYKREDIIASISDIKVVDSDLKEKEASKLREKYNNKYSGYELEQIIKKKLYEKGFRD